MKAILFVILNVSVCFPSGLVGVEILIPGGGVWGVERKKISRLAIARHDPPPCNTPLIFTLGLGDIEGHFWCCGWFHCLYPQKGSKVQHIYKVNYYGLTSYVSNSSPENSYKF